MGDPTRPAPAGGAPYSGAPHIPPGHLSFDSRSLGFFVLVSWVLAVGCWLFVVGRRSCVRFWVGYWRFVCLGIMGVGGWLVVDYLFLIGGLSKANGHGTQYPLAHQTADTRATQTQHDQMCRSCVRCLVFGDLSLIIVD